MGLRYLKVNVVGVKLAKKGGQKKAKGWWKRLQKGDKVVMIIKLATDESWLSTNNHDPLSDFLFFWTFLAKYNKNERNLAFIFKRILNLVHPVLVSLCYFMTLVSKPTSWFANWTFLEKMTGKKEQLVFCCCCAGEILLSFIYISTLFEPIKVTEVIFPQNKGCIWIIPWFWSMLRNIGPSCALISQHFHTLKTGLQVL